MFEYILILYLNDDLTGSPTYAGNFESCAHANTYYEHVAKDEYKSSSCLHENYIYLPEHTRKRNVDVKEGSFLSDKFYKD